MQKEKDKSSSFKQKIFAGIGGPPVSYGLRLGFTRDFNPHIHYAVTAGFVSTKLSDIDISGNAFGALIGYKLASFGDKIHIYGDFETGIFNSNLDFTLDDDGPTVNEREYYYSLGV